MHSTVSIAVHGAGGRMGRSITRLAVEARDVAVVAAIVNPDSALVGTPLGGGHGALVYSSSLDAAAAPKVLIDFSSAQALDGALRLAVSRRIAFVSGTTGLSAAQTAALGQASATIPVLWSANFSIGVAVLASLVREAARALDAWDCEIAEAHHSGKKDAPSGTALSLGRIVAEARGEAFERVAATDRASAGGARAAGSIGYAVTRAGDIVGEHAVWFVGEGERLELTHRATDRAIFARGALRAAVWMAARPSGLYTMADLVQGA